ncbi:MAG: hypothetical protein OXI58_09185 [Gemmatimonadota bacterium]|nr:hypothetical protein [Gemmatimonadota bacterium]
MTTTFRSVAIGVALGVFLTMGILTECSSRVKRALPDAQVAVQTAALAERFADKAQLEARKAIGYTRRAESDLAIQAAEEASRLADQAIRAAEESKRAAVRAIESAEGKKGREAAETRWLTASEAAQNAANAAMRAKEAAKTAVSAISK